MVKGLRKVMKVFFIDLLKRHFVFVLGWQQPVIFWMKYVRIAHCGSFFTQKWPKKEAKAIAEIFRIASRQRIEAEAFFSTMKVNMAKHYLKMWYLCHPMLWEIDCHFNYFHAWISSSLRISFTVVCILVRIKPFSRYWRNHL